LTQSRHFFSPQIRIYDYTDLCVKLHLRDGRTDGRTDGRRECPSVGLSRVAATSTQRDGGDRGGRCCRACLAVRPSVRVLDGV